jgi:chromosome segregation ATPase
VHELSGGQKSICALAITASLAAVHGCRLLVCDEIDASLDALNAKRAASFLKSLATAQGGTATVVVISHRREMYAAADTVVGVVALAEGGGSELLQVDV